MEEQLPRPEQGREDKTSSRGGEFLARWLRRLRTPEASEDTAETESPKKSRAKRLFNRIFPSIAVKEQIKESETPRPTLYESLQNNLAQNREATTHAQSETAPVNTIEAEPAPAERNFHPVEQRAPLSDDVPLSRETPEPENEPAGPRVLPSLEAPPQPPPAIIEQLHTRDQPEYQFAAAPAATLYERRPVAATTERTATDIEPGTSDRFARSLIGLEYIGRHRADAKLKKADKRMQKDVASLSKKIEADIKSGDQLARLANSSKEQTEELRQKRERAIAPKVEKAPVPKVEAKPVGSKKSEVRTTTAKPETYASTERISLRPETRSNPERKMPKPEATAAPRPEVILERVVKAAERDDPIESAYERRHEIKDEPRTSPVTATAGPVRIGSILPGNIHQDGTLSTRPGSAIPQNNTAVTNSTSMYRQAATSGFWTALVLIVILTIMSISNL